MITDINISGVKRYSTAPEVVEADIVTASNTGQLAKWCGGETSSDYFDGILTGYIKVPTIDGIKIAKVGDWLTKNLETGRFAVLSKGEWTSKGFHIVGQRQDGLRPRVPIEYLGDPPGVGPAINSGEYIDHNNRIIGDGYSRPHDVLDMS